METWISPADIAAEFGLHQYSTDPDALRIELKKIVAAHHPDKHGGTFLSDSDQTLFLRAKNAMDFLELHSHTAMIPVSQLPTVVSAIVQALAVRTTNEAHTLQASYLTDARARISRQFVLPKIGSGVFAAVTGFLVAFPDKFEKNPLIGPLLEGRMAQYALLTLLAYSAIGFALVWYRERVAESRAEYLMSESALTRLFEVLVTFERGDNLTRKVSSKQIFYAISELAGHRHYASELLPLALLGSAYPDLPTIEKAAAIQTQRLVERKVLSRIDTPSLETWYELHADAGHGT